MFDVMRAGSQNRSVAATRMNERSSRSHSIFICTMMQRNTKTDTSSIAKLYCVDLAGSERNSHTGTQDKMAKESIDINKSLFTLR